MFRRRVRDRLYDLAVNRVLMRPTVRELYDRHLFFHDAWRLLAMNGVSGDYVEFGCYRGQTFWHSWTEIARRGHPAKLWAFDTFEGIPAPRGPLDEHPVWVGGTMVTTEYEFHQLCQRRGIPSDRYETVKGLFEDTLPGRDDPADVALVFVDSDLYSSAVTVLDWLEPRLKHGMIVAFDDYHCWSAGQIAGERRALTELVERLDHFELVPYHTFSFGGAAFYVEDRRLWGQKLSVTS